jgi:hypothetical protein
VPTVYIPEKGHRVNYDLLQEHCNLVDSPDKADICIGWKVLYQDRKFQDIICLQSEPPIVGNVIQTYRHAKKLHTFVTYVPIHDNSLPFSETAPHIYPFRPWVEMHQPRPDDELRPKGKGVYFAGHRHNRPDMTRHNCAIGYQKRATWAQALVDAMGGICLGNGWPHTSKDAPEGWGARKFKEMAEGDYDFIFAAENCSMSGYVSEKFHHGLLSDRVSVYMGHPRIKKLVNPAAYVFAGDFADPQALIKHLQEMTPARYMHTVKCARQVIKNFDRQWWTERDKLTMQLIERINK